jgi:hypothetical protein
MKCFPKLSENLALAISVEGFLVKQAHLSLVAMTTQFSV